MKKSLLVIIAVFISVLSYSQVSFNASQSSGCAPLNVTFTNTSSTGNYFIWYFGDGSTDTSFHTSHTYTQPSFYFPQLNAWDTTGGGMIWKGNYMLPSGIQVNGSGLYTNADTVCPNEQVEMYIYPQGNNYNWQFGDGGSSTQQNPIHTYTLTGIYTITVTANTSCGPQTLTKQVVVMNGAIPSANFHFMNNPVCPNESVRIEANNWRLSSYTWNFGDGSSPVTGTDNRPTHTYTTTGNYVVTLSVTSTCGTSNSYSDTIHIQNNVYIPNWVNINASTSSSCPNEPINFNVNYQDGKYYLWRFGDGDTSGSTHPTHSYTSTGIKTVSLTITNGCGNDTTITTQVTITNGLYYNSFTSAYNSSPACPNDDVYFNTNASAVSYVWRFGDGDTATGPGPVHQYTATGTYNASVTMTNGCGNDTTVVTTVVITNTLTPTLTGDMFGAPSSSGCPGDSMLFFAMGGASYTWYFGDGDSTSQTYPLWIPDAGPNGAYVDIAQHAYAAVGTYTVTLKYCNGCGNCTTNSFTINIDTTEQVNGGFAPISGAKACETVNILAFGGSTYQWSFGDGTLDTTIVGSTNHAYSTAGTYTISVKIINSCGNSATYSETITIAPIQTPTVTVNNNIFTSSPAATYQWYMDTTLITGATSQVYTATVSGKYKVLITDSNGCTAFSSIKCVAHVETGPDAFVCAGGSAQLVTFYGGTSSYSWTPATGLSATNIPNPVASPSVTTQYVVRVMIGGCEDTDTIMVNVAATLTADAGSDVDICIGETVGLDATGGGNYSWTPATGLDNTTSANVLANPTVTTTYILTVSSGSCSDNDTVVVTVHSLPTLTVTSSTDSICVGATSQLSASGTTNYLWSPSTGLSSGTIGNPIASPSVTTTYTVVGTDNNGCSDSDVLTITSIAYPVADAGSYQSICNGSTATLSATHNGIANTITWSPSGSLSSSTITNPVASPTTTTTYTFSVSNVLGCATTDTVTINVRSLPDVNAGVDDNSICIGSTANLSATAGAASYLWSPSTGLSSNSISNPVTSATATTTYTVVVTSSNGCTNSGSVTVTVNPLPLADAGPNEVVCTGASAQLSASGGTQYTWTPSTGLSNTSISNPIASPTVNTTYYVTVTNANGCSSIDSLSVTISSALTANAGADDSICIGSNTTLNGTGGGTYVWTPAASLSNASIYNPIASPTVTTTYILTVASGSCSDNDTITIVVNSLPTANAGADDAICFGSSTSLSASGGTGFNWSPSTGLSSSTINNPVADPTATTTYTVEVTDANGCVDTDEITITVNALPTADAGLDANICTGGNVQLNASGGGTYQWTPSTGLSDATISNPVASPTVNTTYYVTVTDANSCSHTDSIVVTIAASLTANAGTDDTICAGESVTLMGSGGGNYSWSPSGSLSNSSIYNPIATPTTTTTYTLTVSSGLCSDDDVITVQVKSLPTVTFNLIDTVCLTTPTFTITGGTPTGGTYSGTGVSGGTFNANTAGIGSHTIVYSYTDPTTGCTNQAAELIVVDACAGINENNITSTMLIYPNPTVGIFTIEYPANGWMMIEVIDLTGKLVYSKEVNEVNPKYKTTLDISNHASGVYNVRIISNENTANKRLIVK